MRLPVQTQRVKEAFENIHAQQHGERCRNPNRKTDEREQKIVLITVCHSKWKPEGNPQKKKKKKEKKKKEYVSMGVESERVSECASEIA